MRTAMSEPVALEDYRQRRREQVHKHLRLVEERAMEGMSIAYGRVEEDRPELTLLKAVQAAARQAVFDLGVAHGVLIKAGVEVPVELMTAQTEMAGVSNALLRLLERDLAENRDHRAIITALRKPADLVWFDEPQLDIVDEGLKALARPGANRHGPREDATRRSDAR